jgi:hypothetical protein
MKRLGVVAAQVITKYTDQEEDPAPVVFYFMDDKAKVGVAEPHLTVSFDGRGCCNILSTDGKAIADNHNFKIVNLNPSVILRVHFKLDECGDCAFYYKSELVS